MSIRIEKYLSAEGIMSRREAKKFLASGDILVNNKKASPGDRINPQHDILTFKDTVRSHMQEKETMLVYKPRGYICSPEQGKDKTIFDVFPQFTHLNTVGRLDKESEGLILLSNDGMVTKAITGSDHMIEKEYLVTVREKVTPSMMKRMSLGIKLQDGWTLPAKAVKKSTHVFSITLKEGRKHQIRRMANACRLTVLSLERIRIHTIKAPKMVPGNFKKLSDQQIKSLKQAAGL